MESEKPAGEAIAIINAKIVRMVAFISVMVEMIRKEFNFESRGNSIRRVIGYKEYTIMICSHCLSYLISLSFFPIWSWCCFICCNTAFLENFLGKIREVKVKLKAFIFKIEECLIEEWWFLASLWHSLPGLISFDSGNLLLCYRALIYEMLEVRLAGCCMWVDTNTRVTLSPIFTTWSILFGFCLSKFRCWNFSCFICHSHVPMDLSISRLGFLTELWL